MKKYVYSLVGSVGYLERFLQPQTPEQVAQKVSQAIADPTVLDGNRCFSICVWALPDGIDHPKNVPRIAWLMATTCNVLGRVPA